MKVLVVAHAWPPSIGGAESFARDLAEWMASRGVDVTVLTTDASDSTAFDAAPGRPFRTGRDRRAGVEIRRLPLSGGFVQRALHGLAAPRSPGGPPRRLPILSALRWSPLVSRVVWRAIEARPDVVVALPMPFVTVFAAFVASRRLRRPFACIPCLHPGEFAPFQRPWVRRVLARAGAVLALTSPERDLAIDLGARPAAVALMGMGLDPAPFERAIGAAPPAIPGIPEHAPVVLFLGRIEERKGIELLLEAMDAVGKATPGAALVLAGPPGIGASAILAAARTRGNVRDTGAVDETTRLDLLGRCRLLVLPAGRESFGRVILEAWAAAKPVVVPEGSAQSSVVESGRTGLTFAPGDPGSLAAAIGNLLDDEGLAARLGAAGRSKLASTYTWDAAGGRFLEVIGSLAKTASSPGGRRGPSRPPPSRVLFVEHVNQLGGAEIALVRLVSALPRERLAPVALCAPGPRGLAAELACAGCEVVRLDLDGIGASRPVRTLLTLRAFASLVRRERIDAVYLNGLRSLKAALALGAASAPPIFCHVHDILGPENVTRPLRWMRFFSERVHTFLAASEAAAASLARHGVPECRIRVVHEAVDADALAPRRPAAEVRRDLGIPADARVFGFVGQFDPRKGLGEFLDAAGKVLDDDPGAWALVAGDDIFGKHARFREEVLARGRARLDGRIVLTGQRPDVPDLLGAMDVFVCPSRQDACPLTILEAMAARRPVVATRAGGIPEEVEDGVTGLLVPAGDPDSIAAALRRILDSPALAASLGAAGEARVRERFPIARQAREIESILLDALLPRDTSAERGG